jgi:hypothetical protein
MIGGGDRYQHVHRWDEMFLRSELHMRGRNGAMAGSPDRRQGTRPIHRHERPGSADQYQIPPPREKQKTEPAWEWFGGGMQT